jgi:hypothetical protein
LKGLSGRKGVLAPFEGFLPLRPIVALAEEDFNGLVFCLVAPIGVFVMASLWKALLEGSGSWEALVSKSASMRAMLAIGTNGRYSSGWLQSEPRAHNCDTL